MFTISEKVNARKRARKHVDKKPLEEFNLEHQPQVTYGVCTRGPAAYWWPCAITTTWSTCGQVLQKTNLRRHDIVVMTVRTISTGAGEYDLSDDQMFSDYERELFTHVVEMAEKEGKPVELLEVPAVNPFDAMVQSAAKLQVSRLVTGVSARMTSEELARRIGLAWESLPEPRHAVFAGDDQPGPAVHVRQPGTASAALVAGRRRPLARAVAAAERRRGSGFQAPPSRHRWAWRCAGWSEILKAGEIEQVLHDLKNESTQESV